MHGSARSLIQTEYKTILLLVSKYYTFILEWMHDTKAKRSLKVVVQYTDNEDWGLSP